MRPHATNHGEWWPFAVVDFVRKPSQVIWCFMSSGDPLLSACLLLAKTGNRALVLHSAVLSDGYPVTGGTLSAMYLVLAGDPLAPCSTSWQKRAVSQRTAKSYL